MGRFAKDEEVGLLRNTAKLYIRNLRQNASRASIKQELELHHAIVDHMHVLLALTRMHTSRSSDGMFLLFILTVVLTILGIIVWAVIGLAK